jgi:hypothetical protein
LLNTETTIPLPLQNVNRASDFHGYFGTTWELENGYGIWKEFQECKAGSLKTEAREFSEV